MNCPCFGKQCSYCEIFNHNQASCWFKQMDESLNDQLREKPESSCSVPETYLNRSFRGNTERIERTDENFVCKVKNSNPPTDSEPNSSEIGIVVDDVKDSNPEDSESDSSKDGIIVTNKVESYFENDMENAAEDIQEFVPADLEQSAIESWNNIVAELNNDSDRNVGKSGEFYQENKYPLSESGMAADDCLNVKYEKNESARSQRNKKKRMVYRNKQKQLSKRKATSNQKYEDENNITSCSKEEKDDSCNHANLDIQENDGGKGLELGENTLDNCGISNAEENVDSLDKWPKRWNERNGSDAQKWEEFKVEWSDYVASEGLSGLNDNERKYTLLHALGYYEVSAWMLRVDPDDKFLDLKQVMGKLDEYFSLKNKNDDEKISFIDRKKDVSVLY